MNNPFSELPAALVDEILRMAQDIGVDVLDTFNDLDANRQARRNELENQGLLRHESGMDFVSPTTCAVDGAFVVERLLALDLIAAAAVAVEGLTPPSETRYWSEPRHFAYVAIEKHDASTGNILRALMMGMELNLAAQAPHEVVFLDGSLTTPLIYFNQALSSIYADEDSQLADLHISNKLIEHIKGFLESYLTILEARRSDKCWIAVPKYTARREIGKQLGWSANLDDRAMLTDLLRPGEFTQPTRLQPPNREWHLNTSSVKPEDFKDVSELANQVTRRLLDIQMVYYRPNQSLPAIRLEMSRSVAETKGRLSNVIYAAKHQCSSPAILEPYPLYMADRMVKSLSSAIPAFRQAITQSVSARYKGNITDIFLNLHGYRTETGL